MTSKDEFAGHTPGPWAHQKEGVRFVIVHEGGYGSALVHAATTGLHYDNEANAKLIAAAPRLLSEREELREALAELVALKNLIEDCALVSLKDRAKMMADYEKRKPLAWERARTLLNKIEAKHG